MAPDSDRSVSYTHLRFKLGLPGRDTACNHGGVLPVQRGLSLFLRPILPVDVYKRQLQLDDSKLAKLNKLRTMAEMPVIIL